MTGGIGVWTSVIGVDVGTKRVGIAFADATLTIASPGAVLDRTSPAFWKQFRALLTERSCDHVVVGLARTMSGSEAEAAQLCRRFADDVLKNCSVATTLWDERLSTVAAERSLLEGNVRRAARRASIDAIAASLMLQGWLDRQRGNGRQ